jgi:hypothetical protein
MIGVAWNQTNAYYPGPGREPVSLGCHGILLTPARTIDHHGDKVFLKSSNHGQT